MKFNARTTKYSPAKVKRSAFVAAVFTLNISLAIISPTVLNADTPTKTSSTSTNSAASASTCASSPTDPIITIKYSTISPNTTAKPGESVIYTATFTNSGAALNSGMIGFRITDSKGNYIDQYTLAEVNLASGASQTIIYKTSAPKMNGDYSINVGAWNSDYSDNYVYSLAQTLTVTDKPQSKSK